jgi:hypothetical protein
MRALGENALGWIRAHEQAFETGSEADESTRVWFAKRNGELAMIGAYLLDRGDLRGRELLDRAWARFEDGAWLTREAVRMPALATLYPAFWRHGLRDKALEQAIVATAPTATDPALRLLVACAFVNCELAPPWDLAELLASGELSRRPATWTVDTRYAYLAMHVAWALVPSRLLPDTLAEYLRRSLPAWISWFARSGELDLLGEAIITTHTLGECVPASEWQVLGDAQEPDGLVPFKLAWRGRAAPARARFDANYHSTLVALGAAAVCDHAE